MSNGSMHQGLPRNHMLARYAFAVLAALAAVLAQVALTQEWEVSVYSVLVGAVALAVWWQGAVRVLLGTRCWKATSVRSK